jgi:signal transduction histidine kinase
LNVKQESARQIKVAGVVTCRLDEFFLVQDQSGGVRVDTRVPPNVEVGDAVEVAGFPAEELFGLVLSEALARKTGPGNQPVPVALSLDDTVDGRNNNRVVTLEAVLLEQRLSRGLQSLDLQVGQRAFRAVLPVSAGHLPAIAAGSRIQVTGVSQIECVVSVPGDPVHVEKPLVASLELLLRQPADVTVLQRPPWWNWKYTAGMIGFSVMGLVGSVMWIRMLRRRVEERTRELRETMGKLQKETQISATLAERDRLAGEIHDSLEQGLSAIMMQTDAAAKQMHQPEEVSRYLAVIKNMAGFSRAEVQHAVWDMQSPLLENADLGTALRRIAREISAGDLPRVMVEISGPARALPSTVEHHLLRIGQEAITNAVKHGQPKMIRLTLNYGTNGVTLTVHDDGCGFDPDAVVVGTCHFGLQGLRTRARKINATLTVSSKPNQGATIEVMLPWDTPGLVDNPSL